jgi:hypothetical protein
MVNGSINLRSLTIDELAGVVNLYPWFGAARKELCLRMSRVGGEGWGERDYAVNALYMGSRALISDIVRSGKERDYSDKDLETLLKAYTAGGAEAEAQAPKPRTRVVGGDFFTQDEYDSVRRSDDGIFSSFATKAKGEESHEKGGDIMDSFCTETLAQIYIDQGYYEQAKKIYSKLLLRYPEKSAYFAALIEKLG